MKIRTTLFISTAALGLFAALVGTTVYLAARQIDGYAAQGDQAAKLIDGVFDLNVFGLAYAGSREERPKAQWYAQFALLQKDIDSPVFSEEPGRAYVGALETDMDGIRRSFNDLADQNAVQAAGPARTKLISADLLVKMQGLMSHVQELAAKALAERERARQDVVTTIFALLAVLVVVASAVIVMLYRQIVGPIVRLQRGTQIIGRGDLEHRVGIKGNDEIGLLSRAFDDMAGRLKRAHDGLERKIKERTREIEGMNRQNEMLLESIGDGVVAIDAAWNITHWNPAATKITGWRREEAIGRPFREVVRFVRERDRAENVLFISDAMLSKKVRFMEERTVLIKKRGEEIPVGDSAAPILGPGNKVMGAIVVFRDASSEREALLVRSSFAYASHQLRTPVTEALWGLEAALEEKDAETMREKVGVAYGSVLSVHKLVSEIAEVSEIDQRTVVPKRAETNAADVLAEAVGKLARKAAGRRMTLKTTPPSVAIVFGTDAKLLVRALQELVDNAIEYGPAGGVVAVSATPGGSDLVFEVRDSGVGIPEEQQGIVFTKFFRGQNIPPGSVGAGLGLYIASEYAKLLGGKIWFKSAETKGTSFFISVPLE